MDESNLLTGRNRQDLRLRADSLQDDITLKASCYLRHDNAVAQIPGGGRGLGLSHSDRRLGPPSDAREQPRSKPRSTRVGLDIWCGAIARVPAHCERSKLNRRGQGDTKHDGAQNLHQLSPEG